MANSKLVQVNRKIAERVTEGFLKIEDRFVDQYLTREGETVEEARQRMSGQHPAPDREPADTDKP